MAFLYSVGCYFALVMVSFDIRISQHHEVPFIDVGLRAYAISVLFRKYFQ